MIHKLSRNELIELTQKVLDLEGTEKQIDEWLYMIECNVPDPGFMDLIRLDLSAEEIIDQALAYQPVLLGPSSIE